MEVKNWRGVPRKDNTQAEQLMLCFKSTLIKNLLKLTKPLLFFSHLRTELLEVNRTKIPSNGSLSAAATWHDYLQNCKIQNHIMHSLIIEVHEH